MFESGLETLPDVPEEWQSLLDVWEWSKGYPDCPGVVCRPSRMTGSGRVTLLDVWEWLGDPPGCLAVVGRPCQMSGSSVRPSRMSGRPRGCPGVIRRPYRIFGSGRETLPDVRECTEGYPGCP